MLRAERLTLATDRLTYFAHWITPEENPIRFDTRFFAAVTPPDQEPVADGHEIVDVRWLTADETLEALAPQGDLAPYPDDQEPRDHRRGRTAGGGAAAAVAAVGAARGPDHPPPRPHGRRTAVPVLPGDPRWY